MVAKLVPKETLEKLSTNKKFEIFSPFLKQNGNFCMAYSTLQPGLEYVLDQNIGYISYIPFKHFALAPKKTAIVISNPVSNKNDYGYLIESIFQHYKNIIFLQANSDFAKVISDAGFQVNQFGIETELNVQNYNLSGKERSKLRQWINKANREKVKVYETPIETINQTELSDLVSGWLKRKGGHELIGLTRPLIKETENKVRYFWAKQNNKIIGLAIFDPMYENGEIYGYYHNFDRIDPSAPNGTSAYLVLKAMDTFRNEGISTISLGMSPMANISDEFNHNQRLTKTFNFLYHKGSFIYPFKGNHFHKQKYAGNELKVYFSSTKGNSIKEFITSLKSLNVF